MTTTVGGRARVVGCSIDRLDMDQTLARCEELIESGEYAQHLCINAAKAVAARDDAELRAIIDRCEVVSADGQAVVWASRILGDPLPTRVAGIDLMQRLLERAEARGYRVFILGATPEVLERAAERIRARHPRIALVGMRDGYFLEADDAAVAAEVAAARPDILFVAMPSPRKEHWLGRYGPGLGVPFVMGVGGSVDVIAGVTKRAPALWQKLGLEWAYRLLQEPRRLMGRYARTNLRFMYLVARELVARRVR